MLETAARAIVQPQSTGIGKGGTRPDVLNLATLAKLREILAQCLHDLRFLGTKSREVDFWLSKVDAPGARLSGVRDQLGGVEDRFGGNAADVQTGAARLLESVDQGDLDALVCGRKR